MNDSNPHIPQQSFSQCRFSTRWWMWPYSPRIFHCQSSSQSTSFLSNLHICERLFLLLWHVTLFLWCVINHRNSSIVQSKRKWQYPRATSSIWVSHCCGKLITELQSSVHSASKTTLEYIHHQPSSFFSCFHRILIEFCKISCNILKWWCISPDKNAQRKRRHGQEKWNNEMSMNLIVLQKVMVKMFFVYFCQFFDRFSWFL